MTRISSLFGAMRLVVSGIAIGVTLAVPAHAETVMLPDPSGITLFSLGLAGLVLGRRAAARRNRDDEDQ